MKRINLKNTGVSVSPMTVGCWSFGGGEGSYWGPQDQQDVDRLISVALERGVNFFDTAFLYNEGASEISLGKALVGRRDNAVICNKIPVLPADQLSGYEDIIAASLKRLQTDRIDIMMLHWPDPDEALFRANLEALKKARENGMIREIGVSNFGTRTLEICKELGVNVILNEFVYNLMSRATEEQVLPYCLREEIGMAAYMPVMQGVLSGKYMTIEEIPVMRRRTIQYDSAKNPNSRHGGPGAEAEVLSLLADMRKISAESGIRMSDLAIAWVANKPGVATTIAGCRNEQQVIENAAAVEMVLPADIMTALDRASDPLKAKLAGELDSFQLGEASRVW